MTLYENERIDYVNDSLSLIQKTDGLTFGTDALLLAGFICGKYATAAELGGEIISIFKAAGIPVIRFGLNPTDDLSSGEALCGAYHPALGEMALSAWYLKLCEEAIEGQ